MKWHPATLMLGTWALCIALFLVLPFQLVHRTLSVYGFVIFGLFLASFCIGAYLQTPALSQRRATYIVPPDFVLADRLVAIVAIIAIVAQLYELRTGAGLDLQAAFDIRNERSVGFINGTQSGSSLAFQIGFLTGPIGYVAIVKETIFYDRMRYFRLIAFGLLPLVATALGQGGRGPLMFAIVLFVLAILTRRFVIADRARRKIKISGRHLVMILAGLVVVLVSLNYFVQVLVLRTGGAGATEVALQSIGDIWGVDFNGERADTMISLLGAGNTYLIFVFAWYIVQGMVISNEMFTSYIGPSMYSMYGMEILMAVGRRFNLSMIVDCFTALDSLNAYGFLPSAFGTLYIDYWFFGFPVCGLWGYLAALVYRRARTSSDGRWLLTVPIVIQGILFSVLNTPIGLSNGMVTHAWLIVVFMISRRRSLRDLAKFRHLAPLGQFK